MKFIHIADMHFDTPFRLLSEKKDLGEIRRVDQRKAFKKMIQYIKDNKIKYLFIAGDLYDQDYIRESTIDFINDQFKEIEDTKIYITPGNHDPFLTNSYYNKYKWHDNVKIFTPELEKIETEEFDLYGYGFNEFYMDENKLDKLQIENENKINILITHADLDASKTSDKLYNPISTNELRSLKFDYVALGHIHKRNISDDKIVYPGSTVSLGFDELGEHGMILGEITSDKKLKTEFIKLDEREFKEIEMNVSETYTVEQLIEKITEIEIEENNLYKVILIGNRQFEIDEYKLDKLIDIKNIIKIKNETKIAFNLEEISNDITLKGIFVKEMKQLLENNQDEDIDKETIEKAIEIGLNALS